LFVILNQARPGALKLILKLGLEGSWLKVQALKELVYDVLGSINDIGVL